MITDIRMPPTHHMEGIEAAHEIRRRHPGIGILVLSQHADDSYAFELLKDGTAGLGYLLKERIGDDDGAIARALKEVVAGRSVIDPEVVDGLVSRQAKARSSPLHRLTDRERDVLGLMAQGKTNDAIAESLHLHRATVEKHINAIFLAFDLAEEKQVNKWLRRSSVGAGARRARRRPSRCAGCSTRASIACSCGAATARCGAASTRSSPRTPRSRWRSCRPARPTSSPRRWASRSTSARRSTSPCNGMPQPIDVGVVNGEAFAVMAGTGFDALMIRDADDRPRTASEGSSYLAPARNLGHRAPTSKVTSMASRGSRVGRRACSSATWGGSSAASRSSPTPASTTACSTWVSSPASRRRTGCASACARGRPHRLVAVRADHPGDHGRRSGSTGRCRGSSTAATSPGQEVRGLGPARAPSDPGAGVMSGTVEVVGRLGAHDRWARAWPLSKPALIISRRRGAAARRLDRRRAAVHVASSTTGPSATPIGWRRVARGPPHADLEHA